MKEMMRYCSRWRRAIQGFGIIVGLIVPLMAPTGLQAQLVDERNVQLVERFVVGTITNLAHGEQERLPAESNIVDRSPWFVSELTKREAEQRWRKLLPYLRCCRDEAKSQNSLTENGDDALRRAELLAIWQCRTCEYFYDPVDGEGEFPPGTPFRALPDYWTCPVCEVGKVNFRQLEAETPVLSIAE